MKTRTIDEYMSLPYAIELTPDDGSYFVKIRELEGCMSVGETKAEALIMIDDAMRTWLAGAIEEGIDVPLPEAMRTDRFSGKFALRLPKSLHRQLSEGAEKDGVSLNQYMVALLAERNSLAEVKRTFAAFESTYREETIVEPVMTVTGSSLKMLPRHQTHLRVVGGS